MERETKRDNMKVRAYNAKANHENILFFKHALIFF